MGSKKYLKRIKSTKRKCRSELSSSDWCKENYAENFDLSFEHLPDNIDRIDNNQVSLDEFINKYEIPYKPCIILNAQKDWNAAEKWTLEVNSIKLPLEIRVFFEFFN